MRHAVRRPLSRQLQHGGWQLSFDSTPTYLSCPTSQVCFAGGGFIKYLLKTTDGGSNWTAIPIPQNVPNQIYQSLSCATEKVCVVAGQSKEPGALIWTTENGGTSWEQQSLPGSNGNSVGSNGFNVSCSTDRTCMIGSGNTIWSEPYGTFVWGIVATLTASNGTVDFVNCDSLRLCFALTNTNMGTESLATTNDGGSNWTSSGKKMDGIVDLPPTCDNFGVCTILTATATKVGGTYVYMPNKKSRRTFWVSSDYGSSWKKMNVPLGGTEFRAGSCSSALICQFEAHQSWTAGGKTYSSFFSTKNGGKSWSAVAAPKTKGPYTMACFNDGSCIGLGVGSGASNSGRGVIPVRYSH